MKMWQFILSLITSAIVGFFIILFVFAAVSGVADTPTSSAQGSSQSEQGTDESKESKEKKPAKLKSITVEYSGSSEDGTEINESTEGISVEGEYSDGSTKEISEGFTIKNPGVLKAGETQEFTVVYKGFEGSFSVTASETTSSSRHRRRTSPSMNWRAIPKRTRARRSISEAKWCR